MHSEGTFGIEFDQLYCPRAILGLPDRTKILFWDLLRPSSGAVNLKVIKAHYVNMPHVITEFRTLMLM